MEILHTIEMKQASPRHRYASLVDMYSTPVYRFCRSLTYSKEDADDLFQETFLKALERQPKLLASENPQGFLLSTALYIWKSWKRKYARRKRLAPEEPLDDTVISGVSVEDSVMEQEEVRLLRDLVGLLPQKYRIPVILYYTVGLSVPDIAATLKLPAGTVKSRLFQARKILEKGLAAFHYE